MARQLHAIVKASAPDLSPKTWYGMPAFAKGACGGGLLSLPAAMILMGIITVETQYPRGGHCTTFANEISDLGRR